MSDTKASAIPRYEATEKLRDTAQYRVGAVFDNLNIRQMVDRNGIAEFWTQGIVEEALGDGYDIIDVDGNVIETLNKIIHDFDNEIELLTEFMQGVGIKRSYGKAGIVILDSGRLVVFEPDDLEMITIKSTGVLVGVVATEKVGLGADDQIHHIGKTKTDRNPITPKEKLQLTRFRYRIQKQKRKRNDGRSVLEPIWDPLNTAEIICQQTGYFAIRKGAGLKIVKADVADEAEAAKIRTEIIKMAESTVAIIPEDADLTVDASGQADYMALLEVPLIFICASTGLPMAKLRGVIGGEQEGSITNIRSLYYNILKGIQDQEKVNFRDQISILAEIFSWSLPEGWDIQWRFTQEQSEAEQTDMMTKRAASIESLSQIMTLNEIRTKVFELEVLTHKSIPNDLPMAVYYSQVPILFQITEGEDDNDSDKPGSIPPKKTEPETNKGEKDDE